MARRNEITNAMKKLGVNSRNVRIVEGGLFTPSHRSLPTANTSESMISSATPLWTN